MTRIDEAYAIVNRLPLETPDAVLEDLSTLIAVWYSALATIESQGSKTPGSRAKADCMAAIARVAIRSEPATTDGEVK